MNVREIFENYFLSWFTKPEFDYDQLLNKQNITEAVPLPGKFDWGMALGYHKEKETEKRTVLGEFLCRFKYYQDEKCGRILSGFLKNFLKNNPLEYNVDITTVVPVTLAGRAFRTMEFILSHTGGKLPGDFVPELLIRKRITGQMKEIGDSRKKKEIMRGMYRINENIKIRDKNILIFDDIYDSGATLNECTRILKKAGANDVLAITLVLTRRGQD